MSGLTTRIKRAFKRTELDCGLKKVPAARGATVPARRPSIEAIPDPEPRYGAAKNSGCGERQVSGSA